jgi:hypothetical protein
MPKKRENLVVGSKVRDYLRSKKCMVSGDLVSALSDEIHGVLDKAVKRTKANKRSTVRPQDL